MGENVVNSIADLTVVTGGAGFIGSHLVDRLVASGQRVRVVEHPSANVAHLPPQVEVARADIREQSAVRAALKGGRLVYHLAANPNLWARDRGEFEAVNHCGTIHVLDAAIEAGAQRIVHCSTESILTKSGADKLIDEDVQICESDAVGPYCLSKLRAEEAARARARAGHSIIIANPTLPIGPGDYRLSPPTRLILDFCRGSLLARMDCELNVIDVRDVALGLERCMERSRPGKRYLLAGSNIGLLDMLTILSSLTGIPVPKHVVPYGVGLIVAYISELWADYVTGKAPKATVTGVRLARRRMHYDARASLAELDLVPRAPETSLRDALDWLRQCGMLVESAPSRLKTTTR
jgi:dihydroflavonol-4-reductase